MEGTKSEGRNTYNFRFQYLTAVNINTLNAKFNPICHLLSFLGAHHILHVSRKTAKNPNIILDELNLV
jgi:hypothetical protein